VKTDDYKQELSISATLHRHKSKKNIFAFKKIGESPQNSCALASELLRNMTRMTRILVRQIAPKKTAPPLEGAA